MSTRRFATVAVLGRDGPHVTPVATVDAAGTWWFTTSRHAAKTRMLRNDPRAAITASDGSTTRVIAGRAHVVDPADPVGLLSRVDLGLCAAGAAARLAGEHLVDVAGYVSGVLAGGPVPSDWAPRGRVLVAVTPEHVTVLPAGGPDTIGLADADGPFSVPGRFDGAGVTVDTAALAARTPDWSLGVAALVEGPTAREPTRQTGLLVRGRAGDVRRRGDRITIALTPTSMVRWRGFDAEARRFDDTPAA